jgi:hypothetical protein
MQNHCDNVMHMALDKEEIEDFKQMISVFVFARKSNPIGGQSIYTLTVHFDGTVRLGYA